MKNERINYDIYTKSEMMHMIRRDVMDEYTILKYDGEQFIFECYQWLFDREPDESELKSCRTFMEDGLSKKGLIYFLAKSEQFDYKFEISRLQEFKEDYLKYEWDVKSLLEIENEFHFVEKCYEVLLERQPDLEGYLNFVHLVIQGVPKAAIISMIAHSDEIKKVKTIRDVPYYDRIYANYRNIFYWKNIWKKMKRFFTARRQLEHKLNKLYLSIAQANYEWKYMEKQK